MQKILVYLVATAVAVGCSPYVYEKEVALFDQGVKNLAISGQTARAALLDVAQKRDYARWTASGPRAYEPWGCIDADRNQPCRIQPVALSAEDTKLIADRQVALAEQKEAQVGAKALARYAAALKAISNAKDRADLEAEIAKTAGSVGKLASAAGLAIPAEQLLKLIGDAYVAGLDQRRFSALKAATADAHDAVDLIVTTYAQSVQRLQGEVVLEQNAYVEQQVDADLPGGRKGIARLHEVADEAATSLAFNSVSTETVSKAAINAHKKLRDALQSGQGQAQAAFEAIQSFAEGAENLLKAFES